MRASNRSRTTGTKDALEIAGDDDPADFDGLSQADRAAAHGPACMEDPTAAADECPADAEEGPAADGPAAEDGPSLPYTLSRNSANRARSSLVSGVTSKCV